MFNTASKAYFYALSIDYNLNCHVQSFELASSRFAPLCGSACVRICVPVGAPVAWCECDLPSRSGWQALKSQVDSKITRTSSTDSSFCSADQLCLVRCAVKLRLRSENLKIQQRYSDCAVHPLEIQTAIHYHIQL